jgi:hypothetical protein
MTTGSTLITKEEVKFFVQPVIYNSESVDSEGIITNKEYWAAIILDVELKELFFLDMLGKCSPRVKSKIR